MRSWLLAVMIIGCGGDNSAAPDGPPIDAPPVMAPHTHTLFLNFEGVTLAAGSSDDATQNESALVDGPTTLSPYLNGGSNRATEISAIVAEVTNILAPYDVNVVKTRPGAGTYVMIVTSDDASTALDCTNCLADAPADCGTADSPVAFNFGLGSGAPIAVHQLTADTVAMVGLTVLGIPESAVPNDCMCIADSHCIFPPSQQCAVGGAGTAISANKAGCPASGTVMDENALFLSGFGAHP
jgi:hypothetical protein